MFFLFKSICLTPILRIRSWFFGEALFREYKKVFNLLRRWLILLAVDCPTFTSALLLGKIILLVFALLLFCALVVLLGELRTGRFLGATFLLKYPFWNPPLGLLVVRANGRPPKSVYTSLILVFLWEEILFFLRREFTFDLTIYYMCSIFFTHPTFFSNP